MLGHRNIVENIVVLEWTFSPPDYFEEVIRIEHESYTMVINAGKVEARMDPTAYDREHNMRDELHQALNDRFLGVQLLTHKPYELSKSSMYRQHLDGHREITVFVDSAASISTVGTIDLVVKDKEGNILSDSRRDRIEKKKALATLVEKYRKQDKYVESMLAFYEASIHDPKNELVHLFDIWEALVKRFGGENEALTALGISRSKRKILGRLSNDEPLRQGRHRGAKIGELRDATEAELEEARGIARSMIESYLYYLESQFAP
jgi:hypothetical protein